MSESVITNAILKARRPKIFPDRILMHPQTAHAAIHEPDAYRWLTYRHDNQQRKFLGTKLLIDLRFPENGFAFQHHCPECSLIRSRMPLDGQTPEYSKIIFKDGKRVCLACEGERFVYSFKSEDWIKAEGA